MPAKRADGVQQRRVAMPMFPQFHRRTPAQQQAHHVGHVAATVVHVWVDGEMQRRPSVDEGLGVDVGAGKHQDFAKSGQTGFECTARKNGGRTIDKNAHVILIVRAEILFQSVQCGCNPDSMRIQYELFDPQSQY
jgi:hypothetical protein